MPPPYPLRVLLKDLVKRVLRLPLRPISRFTPSIGPGAFTEHKPIIVATRLAMPTEVRYRMHSSRRAITVISDLTGHDRPKSQADRTFAEIGFRHAGTGANSSWTHGRT